MLLAANGGGICICLSESLSATMRVCKFWNEMRYRPLFL